MIEMHHKDESWQLHYGAPGRGQQYRCIICGIGGASGSGSPPPLTYNCHNKTCNGQNTMWPTPQYSLYRQQVLALERFRAALQEIADGCNEPDTYATLILEGIL
jgi:hypothetical protein